MTSVFKEVLIAKHGQNTMSMFKRDVMKILQVRGNILLHLIYMESFTQPIFIL